MRLTASGAYSRPAPVPKMPSGLVQLMEGLARDVLKHNPENVEEFCARHMEQLLAIRDGPAPPKRQMTLEEKIKRAQEKVRQKAEQRRRKYDVEIKKLNDGIKAGTSSAEEAKEETSSASQNENIVAEEVKPAKESKINTNLNVPVIAAVTEEVPGMSQKEDSVQDEVKPPTELEPETTLMDPVTVTDETPRTAQKDEIVSEEIKPSAESDIETKLKAPVHHDKDLAKDLEVEIFHKPVEEVRPFVIDEPNNVDKQSEENVKDVVGSLEENPNAKLNESVDEKDAKEPSEENRKNIVGSPEENTNAKLNESVDEKDAKEPLENSIENENIPDGAHIRSRRSVNIEKNEEDMGDGTVIDNKSQEYDHDKADEPKENADDHPPKETIISPVSTSDENYLKSDDANNDSKKTDLVVIENTVSEGLDDAQASNDTITEPSHQNTLEEAEASNTTADKAEELKDENNVNESLTDSSLSPNENTSEINHKGENFTEAEEKHNTLINAAQNIYNATIFANKVSTSPGPEGNNTSNLQINNNSEEAENVSSAQPTNTADIVPKNSITAEDEIISDEAHDGEAEEKVTENQQNADNIGDSENTVPPAERAVKLDEVADEALQKGDNELVKKEEEKFDETAASISSDENKTVEVDTNTVKNNEAAIKSDDTIVVKDKLATKQNTDLDQNELHTVSTVTENEQAKQTSDDDQKIIEAVEKLEVFSGPIEGAQLENDSSSISNGLTKEAIQNEPAKDVEVNEKDSVSNDIGDGAITTVDKVLVEEPGAVNDDNDSAPELQKVENTSPVHVNGSLEHDKNEPSMENGSESHEQEIIPHDSAPDHEIKIKHMSTAEAHDDATSATEPIKTDIETSSAGKSSSMDDSYNDEGDSITEADESKPGPGADRKKETSAMDLETAAVTIQKVFRNFMFKSRESTFDETGMGGSDSIDGDGEKTEVEFPVTSAPLNKERRTLGISRMDTVLQTVNEEKSLSLSTDDSSLSSAATIIQAHVRGYLTRSRLNSNKTNSSSLVNSDGGPSSTSLENEPEQKVNKTVLNIHIVPEGEHFLSRDESLLTSMELSLDGSPPSSTNLHPLGYDKSEPRKQLKREDAIQSISPPSNNSGKLSEDVDSVKDMPITDSEQPKDKDSKEELRKDIDIDRDDTPTKSTTIETVIEAQKISKDISSSPEPEKDDVDTAVRRKRSINLSSDEGDVVTPFEDRMSTGSDATSRLLHSGEFHDVVLPTKVFRGDTTVVRGE